MAKLPLRQISFRLPSDLLRKLDQRAEACRRSRSDVIRLAVERFVERSVVRSDGLRPIDRVRDVLGSFESGVPDLGQRHRDHLRSRLRRDRGA
jgi:Arc/MetJ-type ribon-helix-helix transcriptional regulator